MNIVSTLNQDLLNQSFPKEEDEDLILNKYKKIAYGYSIIENAIAVLSDLKTDKSYIYYGGLSEILGIEKVNTQKHIDTIWEEDIFNRIHPDDLLSKHIFELQFFHMMKNLPEDRRKEYYVSSNLRMKDEKGDYILINHRMFYVYNTQEGASWLTLCLYNRMYETANFENTNGDSLIINSLNGKTLISNDKEYNKILTNREREILILIEKGYSSKEIATTLSISLYTVNRHRQNILEKLNVKSSFQACKIAKHMRLL